MIDMAALKNNRLVMIGGAALVVILLVVLGLVFFGGPSDEELANSGEVVQGAWLTTNIPELPPIPFDPHKDWGAATEQLSQLSADTQVTIRGGVRIERGKSRGFDERLIVINHAKLDKSVADMPRVQVEIDHFGTRIVDDARLDLLFLDGHGRVLGRRAVNPLVVSGGLYGDKASPLNPGEKRELYIDASNAPEGWTSHVAAEIIYYRFAP